MLVYLVAVVALMSGSVFANYGGSSGGFAPATSFDFISSGGSGYGGGSSVNIVPAPQIVFSAPAPAPMVFSAPTSSFGHSSSSYGGSSSGFVPAPQVVFSAPEPAPVVFSAPAASFGHSSSSYGGSSSGFVPAPQASFGGSGY